jgi:hypothetical protein
MTSLSSRIFALSLCLPFFFLNENRGATPPGNRNHILTEEIKIKLQRGGTYALPNQWLGNEGGGKQREKQQLKQQQSNTTRKAKEH